MSSSGAPTSLKVGRPKISDHAFQISMGLLLGLALVAAAGRVIARWHRFRKVLWDDVFFYLGIITLIAGTGLTYADVPLIYLQENVEAGLVQQPPDIVARLIRSEQLQDGATVLLVTTVFSIKFSFLFFFKYLIKQQKKLLMWWWTVFGLLIPIAFIVMFSDFIACDFFDERIFVKCVTPGALARQNGVFKASAILDIITDAMLISIPVVLLWNVQIPLKRKLVLAGILCLSIFMIIIAIIRIAAGNISNGQVDAAWAVYWLQVEACVGIMVVSVSAFRALFVAHQANRQHQRSLAQSKPHSDFSGLGSKTRLIWPREAKRAYGEYVGRHDARNPKVLPAAPSPTFTGVKTCIRPDPFSDDGMDRHGTGVKSKNPKVPPQSIMVTKDLHCQGKTSFPGPEAARYRPSAESFV